MTNAASTFHALVLISAVVALAVAQVPAPATCAACVAAGFAWQIGQCIITSDSGGSYCRVADVPCYVDQEACVRAALDEAAETECAVPHGCGDCLSANSRCLWFKGSPGSCGSGVGYWGGEQGVVRQAGQCSESTQKTLTAAAAILLASLALVVALYWRVRSGMRTRGQDPAAPAKVVAPAEADSSNEWQLNDAARAARGGTSEQGHGAVLADDRL